VSASDDDDRLTGWLTDKYVGCSRRWCRVRSRWRQLRRRIRLWRQRPRRPSGRWTLKTGRRLFTVYTASHSSEVWKLKNLRDWWGGKLRRWKRRVEEFRKRIGDAVDQSNCILESMETSWDGTVKNGLCFWEQWCLTVFKKFFYVPTEDLVVAFCAHSKFRKSLMAQPHSWSNFFWWYKTEPSITLKQNIVVKFTKFTFYIHTYYFTLFEYCSTYSHRPR